MNLVYLTVEGTGVFLKNETTTKRQRQGWFLLSAFQALSFELPHSNIAKTHLQFLIKGNHYLPKTIQGEGRVLPSHCFLRVRGIIPWRDLRKRNATGFTQLPWASFSNLP